MESGPEILSAAGFPLSAADLPGCTGAFAARRAPVAEGVRLIGA
ncbi:hypothetical protein AB0M92_35655 [Streptomyces sp. NPDC051582]